MVGVCNLTIQANVIPRLEHLTWGESLFVFIRKLLHQEVLTSFVFRDFRDLKSILETMCYLSFMVYWPALMVYIEFCCLMSSSVSVSLKFNFRFQIWGNLDVYHLETYYWTSFWLSMTNASWLLDSPSTRSLWDNQCCSFFLLLVQFLLSSH